MDKLIQKVDKISSLDQLDSAEKMDSNLLLFSIIKTRRYDLLKNHDIRMDSHYKETFESLIDYLLSSEDMTYELHHSGYSFSSNEIQLIFEFVCRKYQDSYQFDSFFSYFFKNKDQLDQFVKKNENFFRAFIQNGKNVYRLEEIESYIQLILEEGKVSLIRDLQNYSISNLRELVLLIQNGVEIPYYHGNQYFANHLFELRDQLESSEFCILLHLLKEKVCYDREDSFDLLVAENIDDLIQKVSEAHMMPICLVKSELFRDECIKRNRFDLSVQCLLPSYIMKDAALMDAYAKELSVPSKDFLSRVKWILDYYQRNHDIFQSVIGISLKSPIFTLPEEHYERFINDIEFQMKLAKLTEKELFILSKILVLYDYHEYDISSMVVHVIQNIKDYPELLDSLCLSNLSSDELRDFVCVLQLPGNLFQIHHVEDLKKYSILKKKHLMETYDSHDLDTNKDILLNTLFNISLQEAKYISYKYCYNTENHSILERLKTSELPKNILHYLVLISEILECQDKDSLLELYQQQKEEDFYEKEIPLEPYLRSQYAELYSKSLYRIYEGTAIGPKDYMARQVVYHDKKIPLCFPRANFKLFIHCLGSCSLTSEVTDTNYMKDWLERPQLQDHFVACSYISEKEIYSTRSRGSIILGFADLENGSIMAMGDTDIDSTGTFSRCYNGSRKTQEENNSRARFFLPQELLRKNRGYNEIVIERRNTDRLNRKHYKRKPDYIIMMTDNMDPSHFTLLEDLYQTTLSFISAADQKEIYQIGRPNELKTFLKKYLEIICEKEKQQDIPASKLLENYVQLIMNAKYYEDCLKAASEFDIPLIVIDEDYYFQKLLAEATSYDDETKLRISELFRSEDHYDRKTIFSHVAREQDLTKLLNPSKKDYFDFFR